MPVLVFLNAWLITRLWFTFHDSQLPWRQSVVLGLVQLIPVGLMVPDMPALVLALTVLSALAISEHLTPAKWLNEARLATGIVVLGLSFAIALWAEPDWRFSPATAPESWRPFLIGLLGFWLVAHEANLAIRVLLHRIHMEPGTGSKEQPRAIDQREYNAGRMIGMLERWLVYVIVVFTQNYNVIALIVAAKGFARFRQMDQREFAEYVLIGTLASILLTVLTAQAVIHYLEA